MGEDRPDQAPQAVRRLRAERRPDVRGRAPAAGSTDQAGQLSSETVGVPGVGHGEKPEQCQREEQCEAAPPVPEEQVRDEEQADRR
ncbi:MAG: hypothetical protein M3534_17375, partial [Actinomycetota bacterium]|nr:hypothetical protein [Actinomycetota bacterium]